jgi:hypothetical protein
MAGEAKRKQSRLTRTIKLGATSYTMRFNYTALAVLEDLFDKPIDEVATMLSAEGFKPRLRDVQRMIFAGLRTDHPEVTYEGVAHLLDEAVETGQTLQSVLGEAFAALSASQPDEPEEAAADKPGETSAAGDD